MLHTVKANAIPWIEKSADGFSKWLIRNGWGIWTKEKMALPGIYRGAVESICYERSWESLWSEQWFQDGIRAFGLLALEREEKIEILESRDGDLSIRCPDGKIVDIAAFLNGESLSIRHDAEFSYLCWDPVDSMFHLLCEYCEDG